MKNGMTINWTQEWKIGVTSSCPPKIVLSRDKLFGVEDKSLSTYIEELAIQGAPYLYLGGGYVYHEHSTYKEVYRDGANSLVPDLLTWEVKLPAEPIPGVDVSAGPRGRVIIDRFGNLYFYSSAKLKEGSVGASIPFVGDLIQFSLGAVYAGGHYPSLTSVANTPRAQVEELDLIRQLSGDGSKASWGLLGDNFSWQASAYLGRAYTGIGGNPATRFNYSPTTLFSVGSSTSYKHVSHLGRRTPLWEWDG